MEHPRLERAGIGRDLGVLHHQVMVEVSAQRLDQLRRHHDQRALVVENHGRVGNDTAVASHHKAVARFPVWPLHEVACDEPV